MGRIHFGGLGQLAQIEAYQPGIADKARAWVEHADACRENHSGYLLGPLVAASASAIRFAISALTASRLKLAPRCIGG